MRSQSMLLQPDPASLALGYLIANASDLLGSKRNSCSAVAAMQADLAT